MKSKIADLVFIIAFLLMLFLPFVFSDKKGGAIETDENRYLSKAPVLSIHSGATTEIENWIDDNVGGRAVAKTLYNYVNYNLLNEFRSSTAFVMNDWYYSLDSENLTLNNLQHKDVMDAAEQKTFVSRLQDLNNYFSDQGIKFCSLVFPYKVDIYPENFNGYVTQVIPNSEMNVLDTLSQDSTLNLKVVNSELKDAAKNGELVCYRSYDGGHLNSQGIRIAYEALMEEVQSRMPEAGIRILSNSDFTMSIQEKQNTVNGQKFSEENVQYSVTNPAAADDSAWFSRIGYISGDPYKSYRRYTTNDASKPSILIVGDSYIWMEMFPWIAESFNNSVFIHQFDEDNLQRVIDRMHPDIVVFAGLTTTVEDSVHYSALTTGRTLWSKMHF
ncbi:MAG TPA: hypothetical protein PLN48_01060 [Lachnospiraceae bacterium]|nr:hypothetical protein [Lachnospiraceae bacterium]